MGREGIRYIFRKLFWKLQEYRSTGTSVRLVGFSRLFFLLTTPLGIKPAHIMLRIGSVPGKRVSRGKSAPSSYCDTALESRRVGLERSVLGRHPFAVPLPGSLTPLPGAARRSTAGSSLSGQLLGTLPSKRGRLERASCPRCSLELPASPRRAWGCTQVRLLLNASVQSLLPERCDTAQGLLM